MSTDKCDKQTNRQAAIGHLNTMSHLHTPLFNYHTNTLRKKIMNKRRHFYNTFQPFHFQPDSCRLQINLCENNDNDDDKHLGIKKIKQLQYAKKYKKQRCKTQQAIITWL